MKVRVKQFSKDAFIKMDLGKDGTPYNESELLESIDNFSGKDSIIGIEIDTKSSSTVEFIKVYMSNNSHYTISYQKFIGPYSSRYSRFITIQNSRLGGVIELDFDKFEKQFRSKLSSSEWIVELIAAVYYKGKYSKLINSMILS